MSKLLEILGKAITVNTADLIWHWFNAVKEKQNIPELEGLDEIVELIGNMDIDPAQEKLRFYLFENPECVYGRMAAAAMCLRRGEVKKAIEQLQSVYLRQPANTMALYALGYCYERLGSEAEAIEFYQDCLKFKNYLQLPRQRMAALYFKNGQMDKTIREYELFTAEYPGDTSSLLLLGHLYIEAERYQDAVDTFNTAIVSHPDNFHNDQQNIEIEELLEAGMFEAAIDNVQSQVDMFGELANFDLQMADIMSREGRSAEAITHYKNALAKEPNYLEATIKLGTHHLRQHHIAPAAEQFNKAVEINDEIVDAYIGLSMASNLSGNIEQCFETLSLASMIQKNSTLLFAETASLHLLASMNGKINPKLVSQQTMALIDDVVKIHHAQITNGPATADIYYKYGILMMVKNEPDRAIESFRNAIDINPSHHRARSKIVICFYGTGDQDVAIAELLSSDTPDIDMRQLHYKTAILYSDRDKFANALVSLQSLMENNFTDPKAAENIETVLENLGLIDRAALTWDKLNEAVQNLIGFQ